MTDATGITVGRCACGAEIARDHQYSWCTACGEPLAADLKAQLNNPYAKPLAHDDPAVQAGTTNVRDDRFAGFWIRAVARLLDMGLALLIGFISAVVGFIVLTVAEAPGTIEEWAASIDAWSGSSLVWSTLGGLLYFTVSEWIGGASAGKLVCGLRVRSEDLGNVTFIGALVRSAAFLVDALFFGLIAASRMGSSPRRQRLGDDWGQTVVVHRAKVEGLAPAWGRALAGIALGATIMAAVETWSIVARVMNDPRLSTHPTSFARASNPPPG